MSINDLCVYSKFDFKQRKKKGQHFLETGGIEAFRRKKNQNHFNNYQSDHLPKNIT